MMNTQDVIAFYDREAERLAVSYESMDFLDVHGVWAHLIPERSCHILDVGAGSGRDAARLAEMGHRVVAAEPARGLREVGIRLHAGVAITWFDASLPDLDPVGDHVRACGEGFDVILVSAVWMHIPGSQRARAFGRLAGWSSAGGILVISLRHGPFQDEREAHGVSRAEIERLARDHGLRVVSWFTGQDGLAREDVFWETVALARRDAIRPAR